MLNREDIICLYAPYFYQFIINDITLKKSYQMCHISYISHLSFCFYFSRVNWLPVTDFVTFTHDLPPIIVAYKTLFLLLLAWSFLRVNMYMLFTLLNNMGNYHRTWKLIKIPVDTSWAIEENNGSRNRATECV